MSVMVSGRPDRDLGAARSVGHSLFLIVGSAVIAPAILHVTLWAGQDPSWSLAQWIFAVALTMAVAAVVVASAEPRSAHGLAPSGAWRWRAPLILPAIVAWVFDGSIAYVLCWTLGPLLALRQLDRAPSRLHRPLATGGIALTLVLERAAPAAPEGLDWLAPLLTVWLLGGYALGATTPDRRAPARSRPALDGRQLDSLSPHHLRDIGLEREAAALRDQRAARDALHHDVFSRLVM